MPRLEVQRSMEIDAPPRKVFERVADYSTWSTWSPWLCAEPEARVTLSAETAAVGATYAWDGELVGAGRLTHLELDPGRRITDKIEFFKPFKSRSVVQFEFAPCADGTVVTWRMDGSLPWFLFWMRSRMESFIAMDYDRGLRMLKQWIESGQVLSRVTVQGVEPIGPLTVAGVSRSCAFNDLGLVMDEAIVAATDLLIQHNLPSDGLPISVYHNFAHKSESIEFTTGRVVPDSLDSLPEDISTWSMPQMQALRVEHHGRYENLGNAWYTAIQVARQKKLRQSEIGAFEIYRNDPAETPAAELRTDVFLPLR